VEDFVVRAFERQRRRDQREGEQQSADAIPGTPLEPDEASRDRPDDHEADLDPETGGIDEMLARRQQQASPHRGDEAAQRDRDPHPRLAERGPKLEPDGTRRLTDGRRHAASFPGGKAAPQRLTQEASSMSSAAPHGRSVHEGFEQDDRAAEGHGDDG
jgi:hypothetical protein